MWSYLYLKAPLSPIFWSEKWSPLCSFLAQIWPAPVPVPSTSAGISNLIAASFLTCLELRHHQACDGPVKAARQADTKHVDSIKRTHDYTYKRKCHHPGQAWIQSVLEKMKGPWLQQGITTYWYNLVRYIAISFLCEGCHYFTHIWHW